jgi:hypothetical protein
MPVFSDLDQRWRLLVPAGSTIVMVADRKAAVAQARALPSGTPVALVGGRRLRWLAWRARLRVRTVYVALPSLDTPVAITMVAPHALRWTARTIVTVPSGITRLHAPLSLAVRLVRALPRLLSWVPAGDRIVVGTRS